MFGVGIEGVGSFMCRPLDLFGKSLRYDWYDIGRAPETVYREEKREENPFSLPGINP